MFFITSVSQRRLTLPVVRVPSHTSAIIVCREVKTNPKMLRTESKAAPESFHIMITGLVNTRWRKKVEYLQRNRANVSIAGQATSTKGSET